MDDYQPQDFEAPLLFLVIGGLLLLSMFFSGSETAFLSLNNLKIRILKQKQNKNAIRVDRILQDKGRFLTSSLISNTIVNNLISVFITTIVISKFGNNSVHIAIPIATVLVLIFGEIVPKAVALVYSQAIALASSPLIEATIKLFSPFISFFTLISKPCLRLVGIKELTADVKVTEDDLKVFFEAGEKSGIFKPHETKMMEKILDYSQITAKKIMTVRPQIIALSIDSSFEEVLQLSKQSSHSRFPVFGDNIDDIRGVVYVKDFMFSDGLLEEEASTAQFDKNPSDKIRSDRSLGEFLREAVYVFEGADCVQLQKTFIEKGQNLLIVIDEYGGTSGIVTTEDVAEAIFGELEDEYDANNEEQAVGITHNKEEHSIIVQGEVSLQEINDRFGTHFQSEYHDTIGGYLLENLGDIPEEQRTIRIGEFEFTVLKLVNNYVAELKVTHIGGQ